MRWRIACWRALRRKNEAFWRLPLAEFHRNQLPSNFADLNNTGSAAYPAGASTAAGFLSHFVENYHQGWPHIDCSGTTANLPLSSGRCHRFGRAYQLEPADS